MSEARFLSRSGSPAYVSHPTAGLRGEPQAVSEDEQWLLTHQAVDRELKSWQTSKERLLAEVQHLRTHVHSPHVARSARALEREIQALDRKLAS